jgi:Phosphodiester glycosidase
VTEGRPTAGHRFLFPSIALGLLLAVACVPPDRPTQLLPSAAAALAVPDTARSLRISEGLRYRFLWVQEGPWAIHLLEIDLGRCELGLSVLRGVVSPSAGAGLARVSDMVERAGPSVLAAVNGDFFTPEGWPLGTDISAGSVRRTRARPALAWAPRGDPWIGIAAVEEDTVHVGRAVAVREPPLELEVIGGFPELLNGGGPPADSEELARSSFATTRHPRTAVAFDVDARVLWMIVVDGRQGSYSSGMTLAELTELLVALGADEALNMDGGGSSVMVIDRRPTNRPSDAEGERSVANALAVTYDQRRCDT